LGEGEKADEEEEKKEDEECGKGTEKYLMITKIRKGKRRRKNDN